MIAFLSSFVLLSLSYCSSSEYLVDSHASNNEVSDKIKDNKQLNDCFKDTTLPVNVTIH